MKRKWFAYPYIVWMIGFILVPMLLIVYYAFVSDSGFTVENLLWSVKGENMIVLADSVRLALYTTVICLLLGYPVAYILSNMKKSTAGLISIFFVVPMWMNTLLRTYAWKVLLTNYTNILYTETAVLLGMVYNYLPFMILPIYTVLIELDKSYLEAAQDLGATPAKTFAKVVLPLSMPGIVSGITMVFVPSVSTFYISQQLGPTDFVLIGDVIESSIKSSAGVYNYGSAISCVLMILIFICLAVMNHFSDDSVDGGMLV